MVSQSPLLTLDPLLRNQIASVETCITHQFSRRIHNFHIAILDDGLVLEGSTRSWFSKQQIQHAVLIAIDIPIAANNISVDQHRVDDGPFESTEIEFS